MSWTKKHVYKKWYIIYHSNNNLYRGWNVLPNIKIAYCTTKTKYYYEDQLFIKFDWLQWNFTICKASQ